LGSKVHGEHYYGTKKLRSAGANQSLAQKLIFFFEQPKLMISPFMMSHPVLRTRHMGRAFL